MPIAVVLVNAEIGAEEEVSEALEKIEGVVTAPAVYGLYDIAAHVEAPTRDELTDTITWKVRKTNKVRSTLTLLVIKNVHRWVDLICPEKSQEEQETQAATQ